MNRLSDKKRAKILFLLLEGMSMRSVSRTEDVSIVTIARLIKIAGIACKRYHDKHVRNIPGKRQIQCDELWAFVYAKQKRAAKVKPLDAAGHAWTFIALDAKTKLLISYLVSKNRSARSAARVFTDLKERLDRTPHITSDALEAYRIAAKYVFGVKARQVLSQKRKGKDTDHNTSYVERINLTIRMSSRRFTRKTNAFSKKFERHDAYMHLFAVYYNFCRIHKTLRVTPAMEAGLADTLHDCEWIVGLVNEVEIELRQKALLEKGT